MLGAGGCGASDPAGHDGQATTTGVSSPPSSAAAATATTLAEPTPITELGERVVARFESLAAGDPQPLFEIFNSSFKKELPLDLLQGTWDATETLSGPYQFTKGMRYEDDGTYRAVILEAVLEVRIVDVRFVFDKNDAVSGLFFEVHSESD